MCKHSSGIQKSAKYFKVTCDRGTLYACGTLGSLHIQGNRVMNDYAKRIEIYKNRCELENILSCSSLGILYYNGMGTAQSYEKSH